ncbi:MAG: S41 family peptidase [Acidobacteria bacterium]|nr:S41 family peptidase [Acidobacteriota bacterium]
MKNLLCAVFALCLFLGPVPAQVQPAPLSPEAKAAVVNTLADLLKAKYVFPETALKMGDLLRKNLASGAYDAIEAPDAFARRLTADLDSVGHDKHMRVSYAPDLIRQSKNRTSSEETELKQRQKRRERQDNYGFREVRTLPGNLGYLKFDFFSEDPDAFPVAVGAMAFLASADALVIDLRDNGGGNPVMIQLITSYFFEGGPVHLNSFEYRDGNRTEQFWTLPYVPGKRIPATDLYVLTSERTFSGAEEFSYNLKNLKRATLVGETTGGGAHPVRQEVINDDFWVGIPYARAVNPVSKTNWEGTGVEPDVKVPAEKALDTACALALEKLAAKATDTDSRRFCLWHRDGLKAKLEPLTLPESALQACVGTYGPRRVTLENGSLYYQREGRPKGKLTPVTPDCFALEAAPAFRLKFVRSGDKVTAVEGHYEDGRVDVTPRTE